MMQHSLDTYNHNVAYCLAIGLGCHISNLPSYLTYEPSQHLYEHDYAQLNNRPGCTCAIYIVLLEQELGLATHVNRAQLNPEFKLKLKTRRLLTPVHVCMYVLCVPVIHVRVHVHIHVCLITLWYSAFIFREKATGTSR